MQVSYNEFHIAKAIRDACDFPARLYASTGNVILADLKAVRAFAVKLNDYLQKNGAPDSQRISAGTLNAMGLLDEIFHFAAMMYRKTKYPNAMTELMADLDGRFGREAIDRLLLDFTAEFPPTEVYQGKITAEDYLAQTAFDVGAGRERTNREAAFEELMMLHLANEDPAFKPFFVLFDDKKLRKNPLYAQTWKHTAAFFKKLPYWGAFNNDLIHFLKEPVNFAPTDIYKQLEYVQKYWADLLGEWLRRLLMGLDVLREEGKPMWHPTNGGDADIPVANYDYLQKEYERFSPDKDWMPNVVLMAKTVLVWLFQLSKKYRRDITRLDQIPDEELDILRDQGFTGLWLIGLWQRSDASKRIKQICGNPEAAASAYSLHDYEIADNLGGWDALANLRTRLWQRGIRLASDMVPNHTGMDAKWVVEKPDVFVQRRDNPYPQYTFNGPNLSNDGRVAVYLEDHYYSKSDCAVVFKRVDTATGDTRYIYHGNDGTGMPWNDTAQIDFLNPVAREEVMQEILHVARNFPIIRFDAAMVLAKKHIRRLWYPEPGHGGDIATRGEYALTPEAFEQAIPTEFWRDVVDRVAQEVPDTLLLAEAFWMMEGYFTRTLGMHRVYNSAFMNMLKKEENAKYRQTVQNTITFDPQILKRYVNFMNNPDEETAVAQFGKGDKYFGVCTLMVTMPGLPMFGHGQIEGFEEKYGMEYMRAYRDEQPDQYLLDRHWHDIFPLIKKRYLFAGVEDFLFYDVWSNGSVNENVFAYSNRAGDEYAVVFYNNAYSRADGWINVSCPYAVKTGSGEDDKKQVTRTLGEGLRLKRGDDYFMIFQEQRSGLWYIRRNNDIIDHGMYTMLNGFESQVFWNIRQEKDDAEGKWSTLCAFLNGRGTPDMEIAWQEYHYRELYEAFKAVISPELVAQAHALLLTAKERKAQGIKAPTAAAILHSVEENAIRFYEIAIAFAGREQVGLKKAKKLPSAEKQLAASKKGLAAIVKAVPKLTKPLAKAETAALYASLAKATDAAGFIFNGARAHNEGIVLLLGYALVRDIAEAGFARTWAFDRKLHEFLQEAGADSAGLRNCYGRMFALAAEKQPTLSDKQTEKDAAYLLAERLVHGKDAWLLTETHWFDNVQWFNKELSDSSLFFAIALPLLSSAKEKQQKLLALYKTLAKAKDKANYHADDFVKPFAPKVKTTKPKKTAAKKSAETVKPAKAKGAKPTAKKEATGKKKQ